MGKFGAKTSTNGHRTSDHSPGSDAASGIAFWNYPVIGQSAGEMVINLVWILASIFGTEAMINLFFNAIAPIKPQVEVLPN